MDTFAFPPFRFLDRDDPVVAAWRAELEAGRDAALATIYNVALTALHAGMARIEGVLATGDLDMVRSAFSHGGDYARMHDDIRTVCALSAGPRGLAVLAGTLAGNAEFIDFLVRRNPVFLGFVAHALHGAIGEDDYLRLIERHLQVGAKAHAGQANSFGAAGGYDGAPGNHYGPLLLLDALGRRGILDRAATLLDIACGTGLFGHYYHGRAALWGVDVAPGMIAAAERRGRYRGAFGADVRKGQRLCACDLVVCAGTMSYFAPDDFARVLGFIDANLNDGGKAAVMVWPCGGAEVRVTSADNFVYAYSDAAVRHLLRGTALAVEDREEVGGFSMPRMYILRKG